jgi:alkyldihydroxyacetonephosphate synthase
MEGVARSRQWPASIRLVDNTQFKFGYGLKPEEHSYFKELLDGIKKWYLLNWKGFDQDKLVVCTIVYEGTKEEVEI